jgi:PAS domain S-box-containing protein
VKDTPCSGRDEAVGTRRYSPLGVFCLLLAIIFFLELIVMLLLPRVLPHASWLVETVADSLTLTVLCAPFFHLLIVRPLRDLAVVEMTRADTVLEGIVEGIVIVNSKGIVESLNPAARRIFGYDAGDAVGRDFALLIPAVKEHSAWLTGEQGTNIGHGIDGRRKDGSLFPVDLSFSKMFLGKSRKHLAIVHDISLQRQTEAALAEQTAYTKNLIHNCAAPMFVIDSSHRVTLWNRACEVLTGIAASEVIGTDEAWRAFYDRQRPVLADFVIDGNLEDITDRYPSHGESGLIPGGIEAEGWYPNLNGKERYILFNAAPIRNGGEKIVAAIETLQDLTGRKRREEEIQHALSLLGATLESTADGILVVDRQGKITASNRNFSELWRIPDTILSASNDEQTLAFVLNQLTDPDGFLARVRDLYEHPEDESRDLIRFRDGRLFERYSRPQRVGEAIVGRVWSFRDVTEQHKLEAQLRQAQKMEALGTLAGGVAHDFNNILTAIIGFGSLMQMKMGETDPMWHHLHQILAAAERAAGLTQSLLAYSRKVPYNPERVDLNAIVRKTEKFLCRIIGEDINLATNLAAGQLPVMADSGQIEQVLMNLATNARDAMAGGGHLVIGTGSVTLDEEQVKTLPFGTAGEYALLTVSDSGEGMDAKTAERIFEPFFTTKETGKGTGLGLSIVYGIVRQHNGHISVYSEPGMGTAFKILLPLSGAVGKAGARPEHLVVAGGNETLLVVEDNADIRHLLREVLTGAGYAVIDAADGEEGVERLREHREEVALVILDVILPKKNGLETYKTMKEIKEEIKALFMSGYTADIISRNGVMEGHYNFIAKPLTPRALLAKVRDVLDGCP